MKVSSLLTTGWVAWFALLNQGATADVGYSCDELCDTDCIELVVNGGFEDEVDQLSGWITQGLEDQCEVVVNDGTVVPFPDAIFTDIQAPIEEEFDVFTQTRNPGKCKLMQTVDPLSNTVTLAVLSWKDRIFMHDSNGFEDPTDEAMVRVCMGDHLTQTEIDQVWSTDPGDPVIEPGPNFRNYDVTAMMQGGGQVDLVFEQNNQNFFFNSFWDSVSLKICTGSHQPIPVDKGPPTGGGMGDPHFKTWRGHWYDFHGICDMVLVHSEEFGNGLGLDIHLRTKARYEYSFIESAAVRIGDDILEVTSWGEYWMNGVGGADLEFMGDDFFVTHTADGKKKHRFVIQTNEEAQEAIVVKTFKDMVSVTVENATEANFGSSVGMMGSFKDGSLVGRDGATVIQKEVGIVNAFGKGWQVLESEPLLFIVPTDKSFGTCAAPSATDTSRRRLGEGVSMEDAERACAHHEDSQKRDMCVFDVVAMGDLEIAGVHGAY